MGNQFLTVQVDRCDNVLFSFCVYDYDWNIQFNNTYYVDGTNENIPIPH